MSDLNQVFGLRIGHAQDVDAATGLTAILCPQGATGGVSRRGASISTRQMGALSPGHAVAQVHAVLFTGGSAFGLDAAAGVMGYLEEQGVGFDVGVTRVPIVPTAALFDLRLGQAKVRPTPEMARAACEAASSKTMAQGSVGAGCGASVGKLMGIEQATKGGVGSAAWEAAGGLVVGALVVVNAFGDVRDPETGRIIAGARAGPDSSGFVDTEARLLAGQPHRPWEGTNTTLALVATNARLDRESCCHLAAMAETGLARMITPYATLYDGDLVVALSVGRHEADLHQLAQMASQALSQAVVRAIQEADGLGLLPAWRDLNTG